MEASKIIEFLSEINEQSGVFEIFEDEDPLLRIKTFFAEPIVVGTALSGKYLYIYMDKEDVKIIPDILIKCKDSNDVIMLFRYY